jgi:putative transposase
MEAERRKTALHHVSKRLATGAEAVVVAGVDYQAAMRRRPGRTAVSRALADASLGELRRQVAYKISWRGGELVTVDRSAKPGEACSNCGAKATPRSPGGMFTCGECRTKIPYALNVARNLRKHVAPDRGETVNARGADVRPAGGQVTGSRGRSAVKREDPPDEGGPPRSGDAPALPP